MPARRLAVLPSSSAPKPKPDSGLDQRAAHMFTTVAVPRMARDLLDLARVWHPDLIVHEEAEYSGPLVGELLGVLCVTHSWAAPARPSGERDRSLALLEPIWAAFGAGDPRVFGAHYLDACPPAFQNEAVGSIPDVRPIRPVPFDGPPAVIPSWVGTVERPATYVSFGTVPYLSRPDVLQSTVDEVAQIVSSTVVTTGPNAPGCLAPSSASVFVERYLAQSVVLPRNRRRRVARRCRDNPWRDHARSAARGPSPASPESAAQRRTHRCPRHRHPCGGEGADDPRRCRDRVDESRLCAGSNASP
jgi:hypothetical protein